MVVVGGVDVEVEVEPLFDLLPLLGGLPLQVMRKFASLLDERGNLALKRADDFILGVKDLNEPFEFGVFGELLLDLDDLISADVVLKELLLVDLCDLLSDELVLNGALTVDEGLCVKVYRGWGEHLLLGDLEPNDGQIVLYPLGEMRQV